MERSAHPARGTHRLLHHRGRDFASGGLPLSCTSRATVSIREPCHPSWVACSYPRTELVLCP